MSKKIPNSLIITGWLTAVFLSFGTLFKIMHWPGAGPMLTIGSSFFLAFYLPLWFIHEEKKGRWLKVIFTFIFLALSSLAFLFKSQHWPGAGLVYQLWFSGIILLLFPVSLFLLFRSGKKTVSEFQIIIIGFLFFSILMGGLNRGASGMIAVASSFSKNTEYFAQSVRRLDMRNQQLYKALDNITTEKAADAKQKARQLKTHTDSLVQYIRLFRNNLISNVEGISSALADSLPQSQMRNLLDNYSVQAAVIGPDEHRPWNEPYSGIELKQKLDSYRETLILLPAEENRNFIKSGMSLDTEPQLNEEGEPVDWVVANFTETRLPVALQIIENLRYEVKNAESQVLADLLNTARLSTGGEASQIAELGAKLENEKREREIEKLKSERELSKMSLRAKNAELEEQNKTIIVFAILMLFCIVLIFFVIRSNLIRKQLNKELHSQKILIEEKNKEITDSIRYAQRIQNALMPGTEFLKRTLQRLTG